MTDIRTTREAVEVLSSVVGTAVVRATRIAIEVLASEATSAPGGDLRRVTFTINFT